MPFKKDVTFQPLPKISVKDETDFQRAINALVDRINTDAVKLNAAFSALEQVTSGGTVIIGGNATSSSGGGGPTEGDFIGTFKTSTGAKRVEMRASDNELEFFESGLGRVRIGSNISGTISGIRVTDGGICVMGNNVATRIEMRASDNKLEFFDGGVSKLKIGSNIAGGETGISLHGIIELVADIMDTPAIFAIVDRNGGLYSGDTRAIYALVQNGVSGDGSVTIGVEASTIVTGGQGESYGIKASAQGAATNWAAYFGSGNVKIANALYVDGRAAFGGSIDSESRLLVSISESQNANSVYGVNITSENTPTAAYAKVVRGVAASAKSSGTQNFTNTIGLRAGHFAFWHAGTGTVTGAASLYLHGANDGGGTITNAYGLYIDNINQGTNNYAIYTNLGEVRFGDVVKANGSIYSLGGFISAYSRVQAGDQYNNFPGVLRLLRGDLLNPFYVDIVPGTPTANRTLTAPNASGTIALTTPPGTSGSDINWSPNGQLNVPSASPIARGVVTTDTQSFVGFKEFANGMGVGNVGGENYVRFHGQLAYGFLQSAGLTEPDKTWTLPNASGTIALTTTPGTSGTDINWTAVGQLNVPNASLSARGVVTTTTQSFRGFKEFANGIGVGNAAGENYVRFHGQLAYGFLQSAGLTEPDKTWTLPNASGTIALREVNNNFTTNQSITGTLTVSSSGAFGGSIDSESRLWVGNVASVNSGAVRAVNSSAENSPTASFSGTVVGYTASAKASGSQNFTNTVGLRAMQATFWHAGTGTVTGAAAMYLSGANTGGGTITNAYGLYVNDITQGVNNYAIYTNAGRIRFGGPVEIGNTVHNVSPTAPDRTIEIIINGVTYYIHAKTTND